jgi:hypothetical protein
MPAGCNRESAGGRRGGCHLQARSVHHRSGELDERHAGEQQRDAGQAGAGERPPRQPQQAELVDQDGGELLAPLTPELYQHLRQRGRSVEEITAALAELARAVLARR